VVARPAVPLTSSVLKELERLANMYAKGGNRRSFMTENTNPLDEPADSTAYSLWSPYAKSW